MLRSRAPADHSLRLKRTCRVLQTAFKNQTFRTRQQTETGKLAQQDDSHASLITTSGPRIKQVGNSGLAGSLGAVGNETFVALDLVNGGSNVFNFVIHTAVPVADFPSCDKSAISLPTILT
jgi:hypothetical protein